MNREYTKGKTKEQIIGHIGFEGKANINKFRTRKVLITGAGSYIGESFKNYASREYPDNFTIDTLDMLSADWRDKSFAGYDLVFHVAGLAHSYVGTVSDEVKEKYYSVNTDLALETCKKARDDGAGAFVFMSSMIIYGASAPYGKKLVIDADTMPNPENYYGDSKLQADVALRELGTDDFGVIVLRPPMIYGKGCKGNFVTLSKFATKLKLFPKVNNERSMLYIGNLCEFLCQLFLCDNRQPQTVFYPQNPEWTCTSHMVGEIAKCCKNRILITRLGAPAIWLCSKVPGKIGQLCNKAFGNSCYAHELSKYEGMDYQKYNLDESVEMAVSEQ